MPSGSIDPVLIVGGSGVVGARTASVLRKLQPSLPISIGGRDLTKAAAVAAATGGADAVSVDLSLADLGQPAGRRFSAVAMLVKDPTTNALRFALDRGIPYIDISTAAFEIAPEVALFAQRPSAAPVVLASNWLAGSATAATLHFARELQSVESIAIGAVLDTEDMGGPAAYADYERQTAAGPNALVLRDGRWQWLTPDAGKRTFTGVDGAPVEAQAYSLLDNLSLAAATSARSVRFDVAVTESASRKRGEPFSTEMVIAIEGTARTGERRQVRVEVVHPEGQAPMTAVGVSVLLERLLGLDGEAPPTPGLYLPDVLVRPERMVQRLEENGARFRRTTSALPEVAS